MKQTYTGKELDVLYYFGDSSQPGFSISAYHLYNSQSQYADFSVNEQGELIVNTVHSSPSVVYNKISINADGYLVVDGTSTGLVSETSDGSTVIDNAAVVTALRVSFYLSKKNILPVTAGYSVDLLSVVNDSSYIPTGTGYSDLYKYPDCVEGISLIFRDRLDWVKATITDGRKAKSDRPYLRAETLRKNIHPTVKPVELMQYLVRLVSPRGGVGIGHI